MKLLNCLRLAGFLLLPAAIGMNAMANHNTPEALEERIAPEGELNVVAAAESVAQVAQDAAATDGATVYSGVCAVCHDAGIAGAPRTGDATAWEARIAQGMEVLVAHAIDGFQGETGIMLPKGGNPNLSDAEVEAAVAYMVEQSQ
ncbi:MAG: c-type cytochrome [bacterium]